MLNRLIIRNYTLIDNLDITFDRKLNIITGETGAGKSIIMGALGLILGNRIENKYFFNQEQKCIIEGYFQIGSYHLKSYFEENDLDYEQETILRREINAQGKSRAFVNDTPVNLSVLRSLGEQLIDVHSQHATLQINKEDFQCFVIDSIARNTETVIAYREAFKVMKNGSQRVRKLEERISQAAAEADYNQFLFQELEDAQLRMGEQSELEGEQKRLENAEDIINNVKQARHILDESDDNLNAGVRNTKVFIQNIESFVPMASELSERLNSIAIELKDISEEVSRIEQEVVLDENRLLYVNERLSLLYTLQNKHRVEGEEELRRLKDELESKMRSKEDLEEELQQAQKELDKAINECRTLADQLSKSRKQERPTIESYIESALSEMGMPDAKFEISIQSGSKEEELRERGWDTIHFLFSSNRGQQPGPIQKVASGGELSRLMLAMKSFVAQSTALPTIIFDEIDTGISGEVAIKVGELIERLSDDMQVIVITHLPQIAAKGATHFKVYKENKESDKTTSHITALDEQERVLEIAEMLSGQNPGEVARIHAKELLKNL